MIVGSLTAPQNAQGTEVASSAISPSGAPQLAHLPTLMGSGMVDRAAPLDRVLAAV